MRAAATAIVAPFILLTARWIAGMDAPMCPPDRPRPWAMESFEARVADAAPSGTTITCESYPWPLFERVVVDGDETAAIPGSGQWSVRLAAWRAPGTTWLDPVSGEQTEAVLGPDESQPTESPAFEFLIDFDAHADTSSLGQKVRAAVPQVFDRRTGAPVTGLPALHVSGKRVHLILPSGLAHRTDLLLELPVSLPQLVRLQFELPPPPLPEVADLADLPAPDVPVRPWPDGFTTRYYEQLGQRMQVDLKGTYPVSSLALPRARTCGEALDRHRSLNHRTLDRDSFRAARPRQGFLSRVKYQIKSRLP